MEDRMARMELLMQAGAHLNETMLRNQEILHQNYRRIDENNRRMEEGLSEMRELVQQILQGVAVMQADIVRIDETPA